MEKKLLLLINPTSGRTQSRGPLFDAAAVLSEAGYLVKIHLTASREDTVRTVLEEGAQYDAVVCCGGDGTLNTTVTALMQLPQRPPLGYLPRGSTNDFAASLRISRKLEEAARAIAAHRPRQLDVGSWNGRFFTYTAAFGAFVKSSYATPQATKNALGHLAYVLEGVKDLSTLQPYHLKITADGEVLDGEYFFGAVCNATSVGGIMKLEDQQVVLDDGKFELLLLPVLKRPADLQELSADLQGLTALVNQHYDHSLMIFRHVSHVTIQTEDELPWSLDGEYAPSTPTVEIVNHPGALTMLL